MGLDPEIDEIWSTPKFAPMYPKFPIRYRDVLILTTVYRSERSAIERHFYPPVSATGDIVMMHNYYMPDVDVMGEVEETNVMVGVKVDSAGQTHHGGFSTNLLISSEIGLTQGREIHGQPKKLGQTKIFQDGDCWKSEVRKDGEVIARVETKGPITKAEVGDIESHFPFRKNINHKVIRNIDGSQGINQITSRTLSEVVVKECWRSDSNVTLYENRSAPFHLLPVVETLESFIWRADFALVPGTILHDYLKKEN